MFALIALPVASTELVQQISTGPLAFNVGTDGCSVCAAATKSNPH